MQMVYRIHAECRDNVKRTSPCVFSTEEKALEWASQFGPNYHITIEYVHVDNYYTDADKREKPDK